MAEESNSVPTMLTLQITCPSIQQNVEKRLASSLLIGELKCKLELITGLSNVGMDLGLYTATNNYLHGLTDDNKSLSVYGVKDGMILEVTNCDPKSKIVDFNDLNFQKYELNEDKYDQKKGTVRDFLRENKIGKFKAKNLDENEGQDLIGNMSIDDRCQVIAPDNVKLGIVKYIGKTKFKPGFWVGIQYDEPVGKNNGSIDGIKYFECPSNHGGFVRPNMVQIDKLPQEQLENDEI